MLLSEAPYQYGVPSQDSASSIRRRLSCSVMATPGRDLVSPPHSYHHPGAERPSRGILLRRLRHSCLLGLGEVPQCVDLRGEIAEKRRIYGIVIFAYLRSPVLYGTKWYIERLADGRVRACRASIARLRSSSARVPSWRLAAKIVGR